MKQLMIYEDRYNGSDKSAENMSSLLLAAAGTQLPQFLRETLKRLEESEDAGLADKVLRVHAPLSGRLNMQKLKTELEDLSFRLLEPERYRLMQKLLRQARANAERELAEFTGELKKLLADQGIKAINVKSRRKSPYSVYKKLEKKGDISDIHDLLALRLIVPRIRDCYGALDVIHGEFEPILSRLKDYIAQPKSNGYQSLHTTVRAHSVQPVEIQIRTPKMDEVAEGGEAAYWLYDRHKLSKGYRRGRAAAKAAASPYKSRVFVFSPDGDVYSLPAGATPLDFAFSVHTSVGLRTKGARVNGAIATLDSSLENGDLVEIITGKELKPKRNWLQLVKTTKAKNRIRAWLKSAERERYLNDGRARLVEEFEGKLPANLDKIAAEFKLPSEDDLFVAVGGGYVSAQKVSNLVHPRQPKNVVKKTASSGKAKGVIIAGMDGLSYRLANCCKPEAPQPITGYITRSLGITVHTQNCQHLDAEEERKVDCNWA